MATSRVALAKPPTCVSANPNKITTPTTITTPCITSVHTTARNPPHAVYATTDTANTPRHK